MILDNFAFIKEIDLRYCLGARASVGSNGETTTTTKSVTPSAIEPALRRLKSVQFGKAKTKTAITK